MWSEYSVECVPCELIPMQSDTHAHSETAAYRVVDTHSDTHKQNDTLDTQRDSAE